MTEMSHTPTRTLQERAEQIAAILEDEQQWDFFEFDQGARVIRDLLLALQQGEPAQGEAARRDRLIGTEALVRHVGCGTVDEMGCCVVCETIRARLRDQGDISDLRAIQRDLDQCRQILAADMTTQPDTALLSDVKEPMGPTAFALYAAIQELRSLRVEREHERRPVHDPPSPDPGDERTP